MSVNDDLCSTKWEKWELKKPLVDDIMLALMAAKTKLRRTFAVHKLDTKCRHIVTVTHALSDHDVIAGEIHGHEFG